MFSQVSVNTGGGVPQSQVLSQVSGPRSFPLGGTPVPGSFPGPFWGGYPSPGRGVPQSWPGGYLSTGYSPGQDRTGVPLSPPPGQVRMGYPPGQNSRASTYYAAGGMPLAFTQEDFLVFVRLEDRSIIND